MFGQNCPNFFTQMERTSSPWQSFDFVIHANNLCIPVWKACIATPRRFDIMDLPRQIFAQLMHLATGNLGYACIFWQCVTFSTSDRFWTSTIPSHSKGYRLSFIQSIRMNLLASPPLQRMLSECKRIIALASNCPVVRLYLIPYVMM